MKAKSVIIWICVALALIVVGGGIMAAGVALGGDPRLGNRFVNINFGTDNSAITGTSDKYTGISCVDIDGHNLGIELCETEGKECYVEYSVSNEYYVPQITVKGDTLTIKQEDIRFIFNFDLSLFKVNGKKSVKVYVPKDVVLKKLDVETDNGGITVSGGVTVEEIRIDTSNGAVKTSGITCLGKFDAKTSNSAVHCDGIFKDEIKVKTSNGAVSLKGTYEGDIDVKTSNGRIEAEIEGELKDYNVDLDTSNGSIYVNGDKQSDEYRVNNNAKQDLKLDTSNGSIELDFEQR